MNIKQIIFSFLFCCTSAFLLFLSGCSSTNDLYKTFYVGDEGIQYFIQPLDFTGETDKNEELQADITFRYKRVLKDSSIVNISLVGTNYYKTVDSVKIGTDSDSMVIKNLNIMFSERTGDYFISRFTSKGSLPGIKQVFNNSNWVITVYAQARSLKYLATNSTKNKIERLNYSIFMLF